MAMELTVERYASGALIRIEGDVDTLTAPELQTCLNGELQDSRQVFVVDMSSVRYISSMGLRVFLSHLKKVKAKDGSMVIAGAGKLVNDVFRMSGFSDYFEMTTDLSSARERLA